MVVSIRMGWRPRKKDEQRVATAVYSSEVGGGVWLHSSMALANVLVNMSDVALPTANQDGFVARGQ